MDATVPIYTGFWIDRSFNSPVWGSTLTLSMRHANYLITFLAILVTICASFLWTIFAFALHQLLVRYAEVDVLGLQSQIILRNSGSPVGALWQSIKLLLAWRKKRPSKLLPRILTIALPALVVWASFLSASIFVAEIASKDNENVLALAKERNCGFLEFPSRSADVLVASTKRIIEDTLVGRQYARNWYGSNASSLSAQTLFPRTRLPYSIDTNTPCPWDKRCVLGRNAAFSLQTELLDSHDMFGINAKVESRVEYQRNTTCSVVDVRDFEKRVNDTDPPYNNSADISGVPKWLEFHMEQALDGQRNVIYRYFMQMGRGSVGYLINPLHWTPGEDRNTWTPVAPFKRSDSDLSIFWLSQNAIRYNAPTLDPFYYTNGTNNNTAGDDSLSFEPNNWVNVMACMDKFRACNPQTDLCTPWGGRFELQSAVYTIGLSAAQLASAWRVVLATALTNTYTSVSSLGASALLALDSVEGTLSAPLPDNQWHLEVTRWFETSLAKMQSYVLQYAQNTVDPTGVIRVRAPSYYPDDPPGFRAALQDECGNQRIQTSGHVQSFSVFGLFFVIVVTIVVGFVALTLERCVAFARRNRISSCEIALQADNSLHLLRLVLENVANELDQTHNWRSGFLDVPVCDSEVAVDRPGMGTNCLSVYKAHDSISNVTHHPK